MLGSPHPFENAIPNATILIVDDELANLKLREHALVEQGYRDINQAPDPRDVTKVVENDEFDLAIIDSMLPYISGIGLISVLTEKLGERRPPILMLTVATSVDLLGAKFE